MMVSLLTSRRVWLVAVTAKAMTTGWHFTAYPRGALMAHIDHSRGHSEVKVYGSLFPAEETAARLLKDKYGVVWERVAGCVVTEQLVRYADGYNSVSRRLLFKKH